MTDTEKLLKAMECSLRPCRERDNCKECKYRLLEKVDGRIPCYPDVEENGIKYWESCDCDGMVKDAIETIRELQNKEEEVCEWTLVSVVNVFNEKMYRTCTDRLSEKNYEYKYCPYCGRKIKVVE